MHEPRSCYMKNVDFFFCSNKIEELVTTYLLSKNLLPYILKTGQFNARYKGVALYLKMWTKISTEAKSQYS